ncbi:MAG: MotA/TolQ/ExbB proton channel family protein [Gemmatimonadota bacterium]
MLQPGGAVPSSSWELVAGSSVETKVVLGITAVFSLVSWFLIGLKWWQFRAMRRQGRRFFGELERSKRVTDAYTKVNKLPPSPYSRIFREGMSFCADLRAGETGPEGGPADHMSVTQLEALKMMLAKVVGEERDRLAQFVPWLATIGSVGPLLGLLGTVLGVMDAFIGIAAKGSGNIAAVAPGVAEALVTTVAGLGVAIPAVIAYNIFAARVSLITGELEGFANELIGSLVRDGLA